jgi:hypothetical protein
MERSSSRQHVRHADNSLRNPANDRVFGVNLIDIRLVSIEDFAQVLHLLKGNICFSEASFSSSLGAVPVPWLRKISGLDVRF